MRRSLVLLVLLAGLALLAGPASAQLVINEIDYDQIGTDGAEYLELKNTSAGVVNIDPYTVELWNAAGAGAIYVTVNLPAVNLAAGDYYVICGNAANVPNCDLDITPDTDLIQNGSPDAIGLRNAGVLVDAVSYEGNSQAPYTETTGTSTGVTGADSNTVAFIGLSRLPDGADTNNNSVDLTIRCITPGVTNSSATTGCVAPPVLPNLTINDVSQNETNAGTTTFTFTVSLSAPAGPGGVTFDITTADGTAQDDNPVAEDNDYVGQSLTGQTIAAGNSSFAFNVTVNGDVVFEPNETFFVNVTAVTGANVTDGQGQGTIQNDDACATLSINDVSQNETNAGTTTFAFTVSLSQAGCGTVTFDIATADGTAQDDNPATEDNDYVAQSLTGQTVTFPATYTFNVTVNGDVVPEPDETFFVNVTNVSPANVQVLDGQGQGTIVNDDITRIHQVQGSGSATPMPGATVTVEGIVIATFQPASQLRGFFLQEETVDEDGFSNTSEGIFIFCNTCPTPVVEGQRVRVTGSVSEFFNKTEITASTAPSVVVTDPGNNLGQVTPASIDLPVVGVVNDFYETMEGMLVTFVDSLSVSEYFEMARFGHFLLYEGGRPRQFTEQSAPSVAGNAAHADNLSRREVIVDDDNNRQNAFLPAFGGPPDGSQFVYHPRANGGFSIGTQGTDFFRGGDLVNGLTGVLDWDFPGTGANTWRIRPAAATPVAFTATNLRPATAPAVGGAIQVAAMNLLNYFTTIDTTASTSTGPCAPSGTLDCRGADSVAELNRQRERASIVICALNAHVFGLVELENTTATTTINDLLGAVNTRCGGAEPLRVRQHRRHARHRRHPRGADLPHQHPVAGGRAALRPRPGPQPAADGADLRRHRRHQPGVRPALHGDRQPLQVEGVRWRDWRRRRRRRRPGLLQRHPRRAGQPAAHLDQRHRAAGRGRPRRGAARRLQLVRHGGPDHRHRQRRLHRHRGGAARARGLLLPLRRPARPPRLRLRQLEPLPTRHRRRAVAHQRRRGVALRLQRRDLRQPRRGQLRGEAGRLIARAATRRLPARVALSRRGPRPGAPRPLPVRRPLDHQDRRRDDGGAGRLGDLHDHRLQRRPRRGAERHGHRHLPGRAHLHLDLRRRRRRHLHGGGLGQHQRHSEPAGRRQRHLHRELHYLGVGDRHARQHGDRLRRRRPRGQHRQQLGDRHRHRSARRPTSRSPRPTA